MPEDSDREPANGLRDVFVLPTYAPGQLGNARRTASLAADHGFRPVIVCNSAGASAALADEPWAMSTGANTGYGGAATLVGERVEFDTMVLCNDDLVFTDASMEALRTAVAAHRDEAAIIGFLPRKRPGIVALPGTGGVVSVVSGLAGATRSRRERKADPPVDGAQPLGDELGFPFICVGITRKAWDSLGGFDPRFPLYFEDTDLLTRAHQAGIPVLVAVGDCTHVRTSSGRTVLPFILPLMAVGARNYLQVHRGLPRAAAAGLVTAGLLARTACWLPIRPDRGSELRGIVRAVAATWSRRPIPMPPWS